MKNIPLYIILFAASLMADTTTVPDALKDDVDFWARVYREWDNNQVIFYDSKTKIVFDILNLPMIENELSGQKYRHLVTQKNKEISEVLKNVQNGLVLANKNDQAIIDILRKHDLLHKKDLVERLRHQNGLRSQFAFGLATSGRYSEDMLAILRSQGLPDDLLALVFVESLFYLAANSHKGASGLWGLVKETAISSGIHVDNFTDERLDPVMSTLAAARYINKAKAILGPVLPLIVTSYNYGYNGMKRAVDKWGTTDYLVIAENHDSPIFGYASRSYYPEFLAALDTWRNAAKYFPDVKKDSRWLYESVQILRALAVPDLIASGAISEENLVKLNPSLSKRTLVGDEVLPSQYTLRIPKGESKRFHAALKKIPQHKRNAAAAKISTKFSARGKQSLSKIAKMYGISADRFSKKMGKPLDHQPKGQVIIRSDLHLFSSLLEINENFVSAFLPQKIIENAQGVDKKGQ